MFCNGKVPIKQHRIYVNQVFKLGNGQLKHMLFYANHVCNWKCQIKAYQISAKHVLMDISH